MAGPGFLDQEPRVVLQLLAHVAAVRLGIRVGELVQRPHATGLLHDDLLDVGEVLVCGHGEKAQQQPVEHAVARDHVTDDIVPPRVLAGEPAPDRADEDHAEARDRDGDERGQADERKRTMAWRAYSGPSKGSPNAGMHAPAFPVFSRTTASPTCTPV